MPVKAGWMEGGLKGERQRKREQYVCLSVSAEGERAEGTGGGEGGGGGVGGVFAPRRRTCLFRKEKKKIERRWKKERAINITQMAKCCAKVALKRADGARKAWWHFFFFYRSAFVWCFRV